MIFHITKNEIWKRAQAKETLETQTLASEGFIHCSKIDQLIRVANSLYKGHTGLVLLEIDTRLVTGEIRHENLEGGQELFPHIYGALNLDAVVRAVKFQPREDGTFALPSHYLIRS